MNWKKIGRALLFPHIAIMILLIPIATALLVWSMVVIGTESAVAYVSYVLAAYTLTVWCFKIPKMIKNFKEFKNNNKYARKWQDDTRFRVKMTLFGSLLWNAAYGVFQLWLGIHHNTFWYFSFGIYYLCLAIMRLFLAWHVKKHAPGEKIRLELIKYRACGWVFLVMNLALALIIFFMLYWNRTFTHDMITTIAMAAYTFMSFTMAIINIVKYKKYNSPVLSASKAISFAAACVSMVTLTSTMLTVFSDGTMNIVTQKLMIGGVGTAVWLIVIAMAIIMIKRGNKKYTNEVKNEQ
jgi:hypothetical protein